MYYPLYGIIANSNQGIAPTSITLTKPLPVDQTEEILTPGALAFVEKLHQKFAAPRAERLAARAVRRLEMAQTGKLDFLPETASIP